MSVFNLPNVVTINHAAHVRGQALPRTCAIGTGARLRACKKVYVPQFVGLVQKSRLVPCDWCCKPNGVPERLNYSRSFRADHAEDSWGAVSAMRLRALLGWEMIWTQDPLFASRRNYG